MAKKTMQQLRAAATDHGAEHPITKIANNTVQYYRGPARVVMLHRTEILTFWPNGDIRLDSGGFMTPTTKARMNQFLPPGYRVYQEDWEWYLRYPDGGIRPFRDGMVFSTEVC